MSEMNKETMLKSVFVGVVAGISYFASSTSENGMSYGKALFATGLSMVLANKSSTVVEKLTFDNDAE